MFDRENALGFVLLGLCAVAAGVMIYSLATETPLRYTGPAWLTWVLGILFIGGIFYGLFSSRWRGRGRGFSGERQWPDPQTGRQRGGWRRFWPFGNRDDTRPR